MAHDWLETSMQQQGFGFESLAYRGEEPLSRGVPEALGSARLWQEELMQEAFLPPEDVTPSVHHHAGDAPDALAFGYQSGEHGLRCYHTLDRLIVRIELLPGEAATDTRELKNLGDRLLRAVFLNSTGYQVRVESLQAGVGGFGGVEPISSDGEATRSAVSLMRWWYRPGELLFATHKVEPQVTGAIPATSFVSPQQVLLWFDTYDTRRF